MDRRFYGKKNPGLSREEIIYKYSDFAQDYLEERGKHLR
jgi:hypothetical protein